MTDRSRGRADAHPLLFWPGVLDHESVVARRSGILMHTIACVALVAMQLNYMVVGDAHLMVGLALIAAAAVLYGALPAATVGLIAGLAELAHASLLPLDYYEMYFVAPWNSVLLLGLFGLLMGVLFAAVDRWRRGDVWRRVLSVALCCLVGSTFFTLYFHQSAYLINSVMGYELPSNLLVQLTGNYEVFSQWLADSLLMIVVVLAYDAFAARRERRRRQSSIRETFQGWLAVVVVIAYLVCGAFAYTGISIACRGDAERTMTNQLTYLSNQLASRDQLINGMVRRTAASEHLAEEMHASTIASVAKEYAIGRDGISVVAEDGVVVSSNVDACVGASFEDVVGGGLRDGFDPAIYGESRAREWDMGDGTLGYVRAAQLGYMRATQVGDYQLMVAMSAADVFHYRWLLMLIVSGIFLAVFLVVFLQASILLENVVVRGFHETNSALARITKGDLDQVVDVRDSLEFANLSGGINATVGALKNSIAETQARMDYELMTAKAIQKSALPNTFPPFPQIESFDIYASMNAARQVGGDFYDFFLIDDHALGFLIADVSGKGIPAALFMMAAKTELGNYMSSGMDLAQAVASVNYHLCQSNDTGMFVTAWAAILDYKTGDLTYVNAGHNPPLLRHDGSWEWLRQKGGLFLGGFDTAKYRAHSIRLTEGDELVLYTDGVTEAFSVEEEPYGEGRLERYLASHAEDHPHRLVDGVRADVASWADGAEQSDDITILALEYGVTPEVSGSTTVPATIDNLEFVLALVHAELGRRLCPISVQHQIDVALEELFVNVCNYAYADANEPGNVRVDYIYNANPSSITIELVDQGKPFDPLLSDDPARPRTLDETKVGGLGIFMAKRMVDDITYLRDGDSNVTVFKKMW